MPPSSVSDAVFAKGEVWIRCCLGLLVAQRLKLPMVETPLRKLEGTWER